MTGYLECGCCGGKLTKGKVSNHNFLCVNARYRTDSGCRTVRVEEKRIQEILLNAVRLQVSLLEEQDSKLKARLSQKESQILVLQKELTQRESEEKRYRYQKMRIYEDFVVGKLSREQYQQEKEAGSRAFRGIVGADNCCKEDDKGIAHNRAGGIVQKSLKISVL